MKKAMVCLVVLIATIHAEAAPVQLTKPNVSRIEVNAKDLVLKTELPYDCSLQGVLVDSSLWNLSGDVKIPVNSITAASVEGAAELALTHFQGDVKPTIQGNAVLIQVVDASNKPYGVRVNKVECVLKTKI